MFLTGIPEKIRPVKLMFVMLLMLLCGCSAGSAEGSPRHSAHNGLMDLSTWDFDKNGGINLDGEWEFYWQQLLGPADFSVSKRLPVPEFISVPAAWNGRKVNGVVLKGDGFATFRLRVVLPENVPTLAIRILDEASAYRLWCNGVFVASNGTVGTSHAGTRPQYLVQLARVSAVGGQLDIVLQVANFNHSTGGLWNPVTLGTEAQLFRSQTLWWWLECCVFGCLIMVGGYHISLFLLRRQDHSVLYFGLFCLDIAVRTALVENRFITYLFPYFPWELLFKFELFTVHAGFLLLLLFIQSLYSADCSFMIMKVLQGICAVFGLVTLFTHAKISSLLVVPFHPLILVIQGYICYVVVRALIHKRSGSATILAGLLIFFVTVVSDILHNHGVVSFAYISSFGFLFLVGTQSLALARRYSIAFMALEQLSVEREEHIQVLSGMNNKIHDLVSNLKLEIDERTAASRALEAEIAERIRLEREIVKISDNERLQISHDLHDGLCQQLTGARLRCAALESKLTSDGICVEEVPLLGQLLDEAVNHAYDLSRGLWPMDLDSNDLTASLGELIRRISRQDGPDIELHLQRGCAKCPAGNESQIFRIAQEAITNAVKHAKATLVSVSLECSPDGGLVMHVRDNGAGRCRSKNVTGGMGIGIMTHRAKNIGGSLEIQDPEDGGTLVVCTVPCARQLPNEDCRA